jgi:hypothetical protein
MNSEQSRIDELEKILVAGAKAATPRGCLSAKPSRKAGGHSTAGSAVR